MEQYHLIIQKTTTGLTTEYSSPGIDPNQSDVIKTLEDERAYVTQIVRDSDVYSLEITEHFRIYSLIVTDIDKFGRLGFYELKLYGPRDKTLETFHAILQEIKSIYNEDTLNKPYESILSNIPLNPNKSLGNFIQAKRNNKKYYSYYDNENLNSFNEITKDKGVFLINKLYILNRAKAYDENVIQSVGLLPFKERIFKEVKINNPHQMLKDLFLNNERLQINNFSNEFKLLIAPNDVLSYSKLDSRTIKPISGSFITIEREPVIHKPLPINKPKNKSFLKDKGVYLLALVIIAGGAFIGLSQFPQFSPFNSNESSHVETNPYVNNPEVVKIDSSIITFQKIKEDNILKFQTTYRGLDNYVFSYSGNKWLFINYNGNKTTAEFHREIVKNLKVDKDPILSIEEQEKFIASLEMESGKSISSVNEKENESSRIITTDSHRNNNKLERKSVSENKVAKDDSQNENDKGLNKIGGETNKGID